MPVLELHGRNTMTIYKKNMDKFGSKLLLASFVVKGDLPLTKSRKIVDNIISEVGLRRVPGAVTYQYPHKGRGGNGYTFIQPITDSFIAWDVWEDLGGGYLIICSCKLFWTSVVAKILRSNHLKITQTFCEGLCLDDVTEL